MTDEVLDAPADGGAMDDAAPAEATPPAAAAPEAAASEAPAPAEPEIAAYWPDDWRSRLAGGDKQMLGRLSRLASPDALFQSWAEAQRKISSGQYRQALADDAAPEEIAAWRKANGVPDKPEGYEFAPPPGLELSDADRAEIDYFRARFHDLNLPPKQAKGLMDAYFARRVEMEAAAREQAIERTVEAKAEIRAEYGRDYERNMRAAVAWMDSVVGEEGRKALADTVLVDGMRLGDHPAFIRMVTQAALASKDDGVLAEAEFGGSGQSLEEQYRAALELKFSDPRAYARPEHQAHLMKLAERMARRQNAA